MPEIPEQLRTYIDAVAEPVSAEDARAARRAPRPSRRRAYALVAAVVAIGLLAGGIVVLSDDNDDPERVTTEPPTEPGVDVWPASDPVGWSTLPASSVDGRAFASTVWTGRELIVWGGEQPSETTWHDTGAAYDPATGEWRDLAPSPLSPRSEHAAVWTGSEMIVCCGRVPGGAPDDPSAAAYNPTTDEWRVLADSPLVNVEFVAGIWIPERREAVFGAGRGSAAVAAYSPENDSWRELAPLPRAAGPDESSILWTGDRIYAWLADTHEGFRYVRETDRWLPVPIPPAPARSSVDPIWTGSEMVVWGDDLPYVMDAKSRNTTGGAAYDPLQETWRELSPAPLPEYVGFDGAAGSQSIVWTGEQMVVWTGALDAESDAPTTMLSYHPATDTWAALPPAEFAAYHPPMVWAGGRVLVITDRVHSLRLRERFTYRGGCGPTAMGTDGVDPADFEPGDDTRAPWTATPAGEWLRARLDAADPHEPLDVGSAFVVAHGVDGVVYAWLGPPDETGGLELTAAGNGVDTTPLFVESTVDSTNTPPREAVIDTIVAGGVRFWFLTAPRQKWDELNFPGLTAGAPCLPDQNALRGWLREIAAGADAEPYSGALPPDAGRIAADFDGGITEDDPGDAHLISVGEGPFPDQLPTVIGLQIPSTTEDANLIGYAQTPPADTDPNVLSYTSRGALRFVTRGLAGGLEIAIINRGTDAADGEEVAALRVLLAALDREPFVGQPAS